MINLRSKIQWGLARVSVAGSMLALGNSAFAQGIGGAQTQLAEVGEKVDATGDQSLPQLIGSLINAFLGVLGIIFVVLVVYAGYLYLTAAGDDGKVKTAKTLLGQAVIGLVIIIGAYAISSFVIDQLVGAAGA